MYFQYKDYFQRLEERLQQIEEEQKKLEEENDALKEKIEQIKPVNIENINYKIQELVVKELKGTLNIGVTALSDPEDIKKLINEQEAEDNGHDVQLEDLDTTQTEQFDENGN